MIRAVVIPFAALAMTGAAWAQARQPIPSTSPCIPGDPVRSDCRSSPLYIPTPGSPDVIHQAPNTSANRPYGTPRRSPNDTREGVPQR